MALSFLQGRQRRRLRRRFERSKASSKRELGLDRADADSRTGTTRSSTSTAAAILPHNGAVPLHRDARQARPRNADGILSRGSSQCGSAARATGASCTRTCRRSKCQRCARTLYSSSGSQHSAATSTSARATCGTSCTRSRPEEPNSLRPRQALRADRGTRRARTTRPRRRSIGGSLQPALRGAGSLERPAGRARRARARRPDPPRRPQRPRSRERRLQRPAEDADALAQAARTDRDRR